MKLRAAHRKRDGIVLTGGGLASQRCAESLRRHGYEGAIRMVCAEARSPYDRPPLSKGFLAGTRAVDSLAYRTAGWYAENAIDVLVGVSAVSLRPGERSVRLSDGTTLFYEQLLIATGSRPRTLPVFERYENVSVLRTLDDSANLRHALRGGPRLAVIGGGFIGQEVAATARLLGAEVAIIEAAACPLQGLLGSALGGWFVELHRDQGVAVFTGCTVKRVLGAGRVQELELSNGRRLQVDHVVVGVGVEPDTAWLAQSGLSARRGVPVDGAGRSELPGVMAAGDAAAGFVPELGIHLPQFHWEAAAREGMRAARTMLGLDSGPMPVTGFWTDQYGIRIQYVGHAQLADRLLFEGDPMTRHFTAIFTRGRRVVAALLVDRPRALPRIRNMIEKGTT